MYLKSIRFIACVGLALSLFATAGFAQASALTQNQVGAIVNLLQSFGADQATITNVQATLMGQTTITPTPIGIPVQPPLTPTQSSNTSCITLSSNVNVGSSGSAVTQLQQFLGMSATGYFGVQTKLAVMNWQQAHGISPIGSVGPATRAAMGCDSLISSNDFLKAMPTSGTSPLTVTFTPAWMGLNTHWVEFGDGTKADVSCAQYKEDTDRCLGVSPIVHTYTNSGTYTARYIEQDLSANVTTNTVASVTVTVTGNTSTNIVNGYIPLFSSNNGPMAPGGCYYSKNGQIFASSDRSNFTQVVGADSKTFNDISQSGCVGKDSMHVYRDATVLDGVSPTTFKYLAHLHGGIDYVATNGSVSAFKYDNRVFTSSTVLPNSDSATFQEISSAYDYSPWAKDKNNLYCNGSIVFGANPTTIKQSSDYTKLSITVNGIAKALDSSCTLSN